MEKANGGALEKKNQHAEREKKDTEKKLGRIKGCNGKKPTCKRIKRRDQVELKSAMEKKPTCRKRKKLSRTKGCNRKKSTCRRDWVELKGCNRRKKFQINMLLMQKK